MRVVLCVLLSLVWVASHASSIERQFFPAGSFSTNARWEATMQYWYAEQLSALQEDPLCCGIVGKPVTVRFTWIRSFDHPVSIRLERSTKGKWVLRTKVSDGVGGGNPGRLVTDTTREVADAEAAKILSKVALGSEYWAMPPVVDDAGGKDGAQWIVEVLDGKNYHFVDRWSAEGLIRELGMQFIDLSQHRLDPVY